MPVDKDTLNTVLSGPTPGQSWTSPPKNAPWEAPPQFVKLEEAMGFLMNQLLQPEYYKQIAGLMDAQMPLEAIARTILFSGFTMGKWTPDLAMLMYKPTMMSLIAIAHRGGFHDTPIVMKESLDKFLTNKLNTFRMYEEKKLQETTNSVPETPTEMPEETPMMSHGGFMRRY